ncbi:MAG: Major facilitator superfamily 1 [Bryobacterales bacterium]|nr:Major facilitator superfamily 1 [Bryobacterales bacterium]
MLIYGMSASLLGTLLPDLSRRLRFTDSQNGAVAFAQSLGMIISALTAGPLIMRCGKKPVLVAGLSMLTVALAALTIAAQEVSVAAAMLLAGLGGGMVVIGTNALVSDAVPESRSSTLNVLNIFFGLGALLTPLVGASIFAGNTLRLCYLIAALSIITLLVCLATPIPESSKAVGFVLSNATGLLKQPALALLSIFLFLYVAAEVSVWNWLPRSLVERGWPEGTALRTLSLGFALGMLAGRGAAALILVRAKPLAVTLACSILMAIITFAMLRTSGETTIGILVFCGGLAMAPVFPTTLGVIGDAFPTVTPTAIGLAITIGFLGMAVSAPIIGAIAAKSSLRLETALLLIPICSVLMIGANLAVRPFLERR